MAHQVLKGCCAKIVSVQLELNIFLFKCHHFAGPEGLIIHPALISMIALNFELLKHPFQCVFILWCSYITIPVYICSMLKLHYHSSVYSFYGEVTLPFQCLFILWWCYITILMYIYYMVTLHYHSSLYLFYGDVALPFQCIFFLW